MKVFWQSQPLKKLNFRIENSIKKTWNSRDFFPNKKISIIHSTEYSQRKYKWNARRGVFQVHTSSVPKFTQLHPTILRRPYFTSINSERARRPLWGLLWKTTLTIDVKRYFFEIAGQKAGRPSRSAPSSHSTMKKAIRNECNLSNVTAWAVRNSCPLWGPQEQRGIKKMHVYIMFRMRDPHLSGPRYCVFARDCKNFEWKYFRECLSKIRVQRGVLR